MMLLNSYDCNFYKIKSLPGSGRSPGGGNGNPPVFLPGESQGQRSLAGYSPWAHKESDMTEPLLLLAALKVPE